MKNVILSQLYQLRKIRLLYIVFLGVVFGFTGLILLLLSELEGELTSASASLYAATLMTIFVALMPMLLGFTTGIICGSDYKDGSIKYEIMSGTLRRDVYFGRAILAVSISLLLGLLSVCTPLVIAEGLWGWGTELPKAVVYERIALSALPMLRLCCFFVMVTAITKHYGFTVLTAFVMTTALSMMSSFAARAKAVYLAMTALSKVYSFENHPTYGLETNTWGFYETALPPGFVRTTVILSLVLSVVYLAIGYSFQKRDDLN